MRTTLRGFCAWLHNRGRLVRDPAADLSVGSRDDQPLPEPPLSEAEVGALLDAIPRCGVVDLRNRAHLELLYGCGLRLRESLDLIVADVDHDRRTLLVHGKGGHQRLLPLLPLLPSAAAAVQDYLALRRALLVGPDRGVLFLSDAGEPLASLTFQQWLRRHAGRILGAERRVHPHLLRHSIAVHLLRGRADIRHVQEFLDHADLDITKIYLRLVPDHLRQDYDAAMPAIGPEVPAH